MEFPRRRFLQLTGAAAALQAVSGFAWAQSYPMRPVRVIVPYAPGGPVEFSHASQHRNYPSISQSSSMSKTLVALGAISAWLRGQRQCLTVIRCSLFLRVS